MTHEAADTNRKTKQNLLTEILHVSMRILFLYRFVFISNIALIQRMFRRE
jgi:hypothetical protein